jgi:hypothetical protein
MLEWQGIEFRILKLKLHSCTAYRVVGAGVEGRYRYRLSNAINHPDSIPVCLSTIRHESLELRLWNTVPCHNIIQVLLENHLRSSIL